MTEDQLPMTPAKAKRQDKGFTLIELLIVIAILGILSVVVVLSVNGITNRGQTSACSADLKTVQIAAESFRAQNNAYPADQAAFQASGFLNGPLVLHTYAITPTGYALTGVSPQCTGNNFTS